MILFHKEQSCNRFKDLTDKMTYSLKGHTFRKKAIILISMTQYPKIQQQFSNKKTNRTIIMSKYKTEIKLMTQYHRVAI